MEATRATSLFLFVYPSEEPTANVLHPSLTDPAHMPRPLVLLKVTALNHRDDFPDAAADAAAWKQGEPIAVDEAPPRMATSVDVIGSAILVDEQLVKGQRYTLIEVGVDGGQPQIRNVWTCLKLEGSMHALLTQFRAPYELQFSADERGTGRLTGKEWYTRTGMTGDHLFPFLARAAEPVVFTRAHIDVNNRVMGLLAEFEGVGKVFRAPDIGDRVVRIEPDAKIAIGDRLRPGILGGNAAWVRCEEADTLRIVAYDMAAMKGSLVAAREFFARGAYRAPENAPFIFRPVKASTFTGSTDPAVPTRISFEAEVRHHGDGGFDHTHRYCVLLISCVNDQPESYRIDDVFHEAKVVSFCPSPTGKGLLVEFESVEGCSGAEFHEATGVTGAAFAGTFRTLFPSDVEGTTILPGRTIRPQQAPDDEVDAAEVLRESRDPRRGVIPHARYIEHGETHCITCHRSREHIREARIVPIATVFSNVSEWLIECPECVPPAVTTLALEGNEHLVGTFQGSSEPPGPLQEVIRDQSDVIRRCHAQINGLAEQVERLKTEVAYYRQFDDLFRRARAALEHYGASFKPPIDVRADYPSLYVPFAAPQAPTVSLHLRGHFTDAEVAAFVDAFRRETTGNG